MGSLMWRKPFLVLFLQEPPNLSAYMVASEDLSGVTYSVGSWYWLSAGSSLPDLLYMSSPYGLEFLWLSQESSPFPGQLISCSCLVLSHVFTLCDSMDCSLPGFSVHGILQARILEWVAVSSSRGSSQPRDWTYVFCTGRRILYPWATWEAQEYICRIVETLISNREQS